MINDLDKLSQAYLQGLTTGLMRAHLNMSGKENRKCSRVNCMFQYIIDDNDFDDSECRKTCQWYTPEFTIDDTINLLEILLTLAKQQKKEKDNAN